MAGRGVAGRGVAGVVGRGQGLCWKGGEQWPGGVWPKPVPLSPCPGPAGGDAGAGSGAPG